MDLLFTGGLVVTGHGIQMADVAVVGEKIARVEPGIDRDQAREAGLMAALRGRCPCVPIVLHGDTTHDVPWRSPAR